MAETEQIALRRAAQAVVDHSEGIFLPSGLIRDIQQLQAALAASPEPEQEPDALAGWPPAPSAPGEGAEELCVRLETHPKWCSLWLTDEDGPMDCDCGYDDKYEAAALIRSQAAEIVELEADRNFPMYAAACAERDRLKKTVTHWEQRAYGSEDELQTASARCRELEEMLVEKYGTGAARIVGLQRERDRLAALLREALAVLESSRIVQASEEGSPLYIRRAECVRKIREAVG